MCSVFACQYTGWRFKITPNLKCKSASAAVYVTLRAAHGKQQIPIENCNNRTALPYCILKRIVPECKLLKII